MQISVQILALLGAGHVDNGMPPFSGLKLSAMGQWWPLSFLCLALVVAANSHAEERPTRSECIIGFYLDWAQVKADRHDVRNAFVLTPEEMQRLYVSHVTFGLAIDAVGSHLYFQFHENCEKKADQADKIISVWRSRGLDLPRFDRMRDPIEPSPDTIDDRGPSWRD
jgi:hypothetical protein